MRFRLAYGSAAIGIASLLALSACGGSDSGTTAAASGGLEKTTLNVGILPIPDSAAIQVATDKGYFKAEGLTVKPVIVTGSAAATSDLISGKLDVMQANYVSTFSAQASGIGKFKLIGDAYQAAPDTFVLLVGKDSPIKTMTDIKPETKIGVNNLNNIATLAIAQTAKINGVTIKNEQYVEIPFPEMGKALAAKTVDVAFSPEPGITGMQKGLGARKLADTMTGPMADFPIAGWAVTEDFSTKNPKAQAAFQRAVNKAQLLLAGDRKVAEEAIPKYTHIDAPTAAVITLGTYPTTLNETRLQRVADLMLEIGYLKTKLDVKPLLAGLPG